MSRKYATVAGIIVTSAMFLSGCTSEAEPDASNSSEAPAADPSATTEPVTPETSAEAPEETVAPETSEPAPEPEPTTEPVEPEPTEEPVATQAESCDWDNAKIDYGADAGIPSEPGSDPAAAIIGAWQHTHIDTGSGFEPLSPGTDIRYVFPSATRLLYCQDVTGATNQAENAVDIEINGTTIVLPAPATGYEMTAWTAESMLWTNERDGSTYLLRRR